MRTHLHLHWSHLFHISQNNNNFAIYHFFLIDPKSLCPRLFIRFFSSTVIGAEMRSNLLEPRLWRLFSLFELVVGIWWLTPPSKAASRPGVDTAVALATDTTTAAAGSPVHCTDGHHSKQTITYFFFLLTVSAPLDDHRTITWSSAEQNRWKTSQ